MRNNDARKLSPQAQEALRKRAVDAINDGMSQTEAARVFGVSRTSVSTWVRLFRQGGMDALNGKKKGRHKGKRLKPWQSAQVVRIIIDKCPDQVKLPWALWTREAVARYIKVNFDIKLSRWTVGRYLKDWGMTPQKPAKRALQQNPEAVKRWLETEYPAIRAQAKAEEADIHWGDECGFRSDHQSGTTWGLKGHTPVVPGTGDRFSVNMISTVNNRGLLRFMIYGGSFTSDVFIKFLDRLLKSTDRKVFLIVDNHSVHRSKAVKEWLAEEKHSKWLRLFYLPPYSPQLNPDEYLNNDVKSNAVGRKRAQNKMELERNVRSNLQSTQRRPGKVKSFFRAKTVQYAGDYSVQ